ncbi:hypothetical protein TWF694_010868 [Orbilia ellipsospora]|uniref:Uncharacterized protein n=1 Tax=Orbilia ellipsospora TaxID=2528407 RepID=A0AAV9X8F3_9PEZI
MIGEYFQIRDDYKNLTDNTYTNQKGFCEDLDEGKFSYLVVHAWNSPNSERLQELFQQRKKNKGMTRAEKEEVLDILRKTGSFKYTEEKMDTLQRKIEEVIQRFEDITWRENWTLRLIMHQLTKKT